jgi:hypothetical protein
MVTLSGESRAFDAFIDATGQHTLSARDLPFPTLLEQGVFRKATTRTAATLDAEPSTVRTGGVDLDDKFRPVFEANLSNEIYCGAISFLLHKLPFVQGITSARDIGGVIAGAILETAETPALTAA